MNLCYKCTFLHISLHTSMYVCRYIGTFACHINSVDELWESRINFNASRRTRMQFTLFVVMARLIRPPRFGATTAALKRQRRWCFIVGNKNKKLAINGGNTKPTSIRNNPTNQPHHLCRPNERTNERTNMQNKMISALATAARNFDVVRDNASTIESDI